MGLDGAAMSMSCETNESSNAAGAKPRRPWWRLHASTLVCLLLALAVLAVLVVPGEAINWLRQSGTMVEAGWPYRYAFGTIPGPAREPAVGWLDPKLWWTPGLKWLRIDGRGLANDAAVVVVTLVVVGALVEGRRRRRRSAWQFTLGEVLAVTLLVAGIAAWLAHNKSVYDRQRAALAALDAHFYKPPITGLLGPNTVYRGPRWLARLLPSARRSWFLRCESLALAKQEGDRIPVENLARLRTIKTLTLIGAWSDTEVITIAGLLPLEYLSIRSANVGEAGVAAAARMPTITSLSLEGVIPGNKGVEAMAASPTLWEVYIDQTRMTEEQILRLAAGRCLVGVTIDHCICEPKRLTPDSDLAERVEATRQRAIITEQGTMKISWQPMPMH